MTACQFILTQDYPAFGSVPAEIIKARGKVVSLVYLYTFKFGEFFREYQDPMFDSIWSAILNNKVQATKQCEKLVRSTVKYMGEITLMPSKTQFIKMNLMKIFDLLILPNISITEDDFNEYEDDPDAYIRNDLEESDTETRRRHCMKFVQQLSKKFPDDVGSLVGNYVNTYLADYQTNRDQHWTKKTTLLNLLITASISSYTYRNGATDLKIPESALFNYIETLILPELQEAEVDKLNLLKATCIKFVYMFRNQIPDEHVQSYLKEFAKFLQSMSIVN